MNIKTLYLIRHAKSDWNEEDASDFERGLNTRGFKDLNMMGSYISLRNIKPDLILSSSALRAQLTADKLSEKIGYKGKTHYMKELYLVCPETLLDTIRLQDNQYDHIFLIGHNPELTEFANFLTKDHFGKLPTLGIVTINIDIKSWEDIEEGKGEVDSFVYPKQFKYYLPKQIRTTWDKREK